MNSGKGKLHSNNKKSIWCIARDDNTNPTHFQVFGERRSGTNFLSHLVERNLRVKQVFDYGWKHGFPVMPGIAPDALLIVCVRHPVDWLTGIHAQPFEAPAMKGLTFSEFIRKPWEGNFVPKKLGRYKYGLKAFHFTRNVPLQYDRHPIEGRQLRNVLELRTLKLAAQSGLVARAHNACVVRYEDVKRDPVGFIKELSSSFEVKLAGTEFKDVEHVGPRSPALRLDRSTISESDLAFIRQELDLELEAKFGYSVDAPT